MNVNSARERRTKWVTIRSNQTCPCCGSKKGRCGILIDEDTNEVILYRCKYNESGSPDGKGWYIHKVDNTQSTFKPINVEEIRKSNKSKEISEEDIFIRDKVYRKMRDIFFNINRSFLYKNHKEYLLNKGFSEKEIEHIGFFSIPNDSKVVYNGITCKIKTAIVNELRKNFKDEEILRVPGFSLVTGEKKYITFNNMYKDDDSFKYKDGFFIPYKNENGLIVSMQYRMTSSVLDSHGKPIRYRWYTSEGLSSGSPIDYYKPAEITLDNVMLISEGAIKTKYAANILKVRSLAEAGVSNYKNVIRTLQNIEKKENKKYQVLLALDMDKYSNKDVLQSEIATVTMLKSLGYQVTILEWNENEGKGIDDKLFSAGKSGLRYLTI